MGRRNAAGRCVRPDNAESMAFPTAAEEGESESQVCEQSLVFRMGMVLICRIK
jgi:hypothetical protein